MQRRTTPLEAFQEAARFTSTMLQQPIEENRERNLDKINLHLARINLKVDEEMSKHQFVGGNDESSDRDAYTKYLNNLKGFIDNEFSVIRGDRSSVFYDEQMKQARRMLHVRAEGKVMEKAEQWRTERGLIALGDNLEKWRNAEDREPEEILKMIGEEIKNTRGDRSEGVKGLGLTYEQENNLLRANQILYYQSYMMKTARGVTDHKQLRKTLDDARAKFDAVLGAETEEVDEAGNRKRNPWTFKDKDKFDEELRQGRNFDIWSERESYIQNRIAAASSDRELRQTNEESKKFREEFSKYFDTNNKDYYGDLNADQMRQADGWFRNLDGYLRQGSGAARQTQVKLPLIIDKQDSWYFIMDAVNYKKDLILNGGTYKFQDLNTAVDQVLFLDREAFYKNNGGENAYTRGLWQEQEGRHMRMFWAEMEKYLGDHNPDLLATYQKFVNAETYINRQINRQDNDFYHADFLTDRGQKAISFFKNLFLQQGISNTAALITEMQAYTGGGLLAMSSQLQHTNSNDPGVQIKRNFEINGVLTSAAADDMVHKDTNTGRAVFRNGDQQKLIEAHANREMHRIASIMDIDLRVNKIDMAWMPSTKRKGDIQPKAMFTVGTGANERHYYLDYDRNGNEVVKNLRWDENRRIWVEGVERQGGQARTQSESNHARSVQRNSDRANLVGQRHPLTGNELDYKTTPTPNFNDNPTNSAYRRRSWTNYTEANRLEEWADYCRRLRDEPAFVIQIIDSGKNPLTGDRLNISSKPPNITDRAWAVNFTNDSDKRQAWIEYFQQQVRR